MEHLIFLGDDLDFKFQFRAVLNIFWSGGQECGFSMHQQEFNAIIPARGGSKGLPRKNSRLLAGKPLITYSIQAALACSMVDRCIVSTEDPEIKETSLLHKTEVIDHPTALITDETLTRDVVTHVLEPLFGV